MRSRVQAWVNVLACVLCVGLASSARAEGPALVQDRVQACVAAGRELLPDRAALGREVQSCADTLEFDCITGRLGLLNARGRRADRYECWDAQVAAWEDARGAALADLLARIGELDDGPTDERAALGRAAMAADAAWAAAMRADCLMDALRWTGTLRVTEPFECPLRAEVGRTVGHLLWANDLLGG